MTTAPRKQNSKKVKPLVTAAQVMKEVRKQRGQKFTIGQLWNTLAPKQERGWHEIKAILMGDSRYEKFSANFWRLTEEPAPPEAPAKVTDIATRRTRKTKRAASRRASKAVEAVNEDSDTQGGTRPQIEGDDGDGS